MPDEWFIRVEGKEYGPADLDTLREWKVEGRLLPTNDARRADSTTWETAATIDNLFEVPPPPVQKLATPQFRTAVSTRKILPETFRIYTRGFFKYLGLTLLVLGPSLCAQFASTFITGSPTAKPDMGTLVAVGFNICMGVLALVLTPIYIAGIQILTAAFAAGERISFFTVLNEAVKFWPRVAFLWLFVVICYLFWFVVPTGVILTIILSGVSAASIFFCLLILSLMVWITGRLFINFLFWQQFAVLEGCNALESLRRSRELARSGKDLPWYRRPMWRGVFIASLWFAVVFALNWPLVSEVFRVAWHASDPQAMKDAWSNLTKDPGLAGSTFAANLLQAILKPLLGIAFVLLFLDCNLSADNE